MIIATLNQKGGVAKTTTALNTGAGLRKQGKKEYKVLYIDLDPQANLTATLGGLEHPSTIYEVLTGELPAAQAILTTPEGDLIPGSPNLAGADILITGDKKEYRLKEAIQDLYSDYDYIIIDTPPALGILTVNALTASSHVIIPAQADQYSLQGIGNLYRTIREIKNKRNKDLEILGILLTRFNPRTVLAQDLANMLRETAEALNIRVFNTVIRECNAIKEAQTLHQNIFQYAPGSNAAKDYKNYLKEIA